MLPSPLQAKNFDYAGPFSVETLEAIDADILFLVTWEKEARQGTIAKLRKDSLWRQLKVVQNNHIYLVDAEYWYRDSSVLGINAVINDFFQYLVRLS